LESVITAEMGYIIAINGNNLEGAELAFSALEMAQQHKNKQALGIIYQDLAICFRNDSAKHKQYLLKALSNSETAGDYFNLTAILVTLSKYYSSVQQKDSALYYAQRNYELSLSKKLETDLSSSLIQLARVHYYDFNNKGIALEYMKKALTAKNDLENSENFVRVYTAMAEIFESQAMTDSALYYNNKAFLRLEQAPFRFTLTVYSLYKKIYSTINSDSTLKYYKLYEITKDSIDKMSSTQQQQLLAIKKDIEIEKIDFQRKQNIQFALIALGIITFIIFFLLLSRRFITNAKVIEFFGVIALLIVFEFLNLLLHPFLERITHHSPVLMLLALVCIAALLVPLHHYLQKMITHKLVEKNKTIRLASAKKTIKELEKKE
jgi:tetratricopeptide (TPR) repeat protein